MGIWVSAAEHGQRWREGAGCRAALLRGRRPLLPQMGSLWTPGAATVPTRAPLHPPQVIASEVVQYLRDAGGDEVARRDAVHQLCDAAERYAPDHQWFVDTMNQLFEVAGERAGGAGGPGRARDTGGRGGPYDRRPPLFSGSCSGCSL